MYIYTPVSLSVDFLFVDTQHADIHMHTYMQARMHAHIHTYRQRDGQIDRRVDMCIYVLGM